ncbi:MAG: hypothetical protein K0M64_10585, partial [Rhizobium sp.]|nr:hypothetical protein [Rhizobium sp.]
MSAQAPAPTLAELAERFGLELRGDGATRIRGVATHARAGARRRGLRGGPRAGGAIWGAPSSVSPSPIPRPPRRTISS